MVNPERKRPVGRRKCRYEDKINVYLREIGWKIVKWIYLSQDRDRWKDCV